MCKNKFFKSLEMKNELHAKFRKKNNIFTNNLLIRQVTNYTLFDSI